MNNNSPNRTLFILVILILFAIVMFKSCTEPSASEQWYQENKEAIDTYNENHKDDWDGYKGCRRNSWAEDQKLEHDGYDPETYRKEHGY